MPSWAVAKSRAMSFRPPVRWSPVLDVGYGNPAKPPNARAFSGHLTYVKDNALTLAVSLH